MTVSRQLVSDLKFWRIVRETPVRKRREIAKSLKPNHISDLCEIFHNICRGVCEMDASTYKTLNRRRKLARILANRHISLEEKHRVIRSVFGLPLLTLAAGVAIPVVEAAIRKSK